MNIGIVSYWFNRGQATVSRQIRAIYDELGHETFVLARPTKTNFTRPNFVSNQGIWKQNRVEAASSFDIPEIEYLEWAKRNHIDVAFFDQNYQFDEIARMRADGVKTIGRFVWEDFDPKHAEAAKQAYDTIYSLTRCEAERYSSFGINSPYLRWGCFPELDGYRQTRENEGRRFLYIGGYMSTRKPSGATIRAFSDVESTRNELLVKTQRSVEKSDFSFPRTIEDLTKKRRTMLSDDTALHLDSRIQVLSEDMSHEDYLHLFAGSDVSLAPSRWEGLGLHLFEAMSLGLPTITCNIPPINEVIEDGVSGVLVESQVIGRRQNGILVYEPKVASLRSAIAAFSDAHFLKDLLLGTAESRKKRDWRYTVADYSELLTA